MLVLTYFIKGKYQVKIKKYYFFYNKVKVPVKIYIYSKIITLVTHPKNNDNGDQKTMKKIRKAYP